MGVVLLCALAALPAPAGWKTSNELETYDRENIYKAINGAADLYMSYGFRELRVREYSRGDLAVELEVYELETELDAFGVLHRERPRSGFTEIDVGAEAVATPIQCVARHGRFYLKAKAFSGTLDAAACTGLLKPTVAALGAAREPTELSLLPTAGRVAGSLGYQRERYLGLSSLVRCVHGSYEHAGRSYRVFTMVDPDWEALTNGFESMASQPWPVLRRQIPYTGWVAIAKTERGVVGVVTEDESTAVELLRRVAK